jgi:hypothetical protein
LHGLVVCSVATVGRSQGTCRWAWTTKTERRIAGLVAGQAAARGALTRPARLSTYRGLRDVQIEWLGARLQPEQPAELASQRQPIEVVDYRGLGHPRVILQRLLEEGDVQVWREAGARDILDGHNRLELQPSDALAIWTTPPGPAELQLALEKVSPSKVYLFGIPPETDHLETFLQRLSGLLKHALKASQGHASLFALAAATGQRKVTVRLGLDWLEGCGYIRVVAEGPEEIVIATGDGVPCDDLPQREARLKASLAETAAYRLYFLKADKDNLEG